jgi:hypothetical protein
MTAEDDDAERTTSIGLYNYAGSYSRCANNLARVKPKGVTHPDEPIDFLFYHSIELVGPKKIETGPRKQRLGPTVGSRFSG